MGVAANAPDVQVMDIVDAGDVRIGTSMRSNSMPLGVPSSRMLRLSRMMPMEDHRIMTPMPMESAGSIQRWPVRAMATPPAMTAAVDSVSPISCTMALRRLMSRWPRMSSSAIPPFMTTPAAATQIISCAWTSTGFSRR